MLEGIIKTLKEFIDKIVERLRNPFAESTSTPFAGAFVVAMTITHWELVIQLLYFDGDDTRNERIDIITNYVQCETLWSGILWPVGLALISMVSYYIINNLAFLLGLVFNTYLKGYILLKTDKIKVKTKEDFDRVVRILDSYRVRYEKTNEQYEKAEVQRESLDKNVGTLTTSLADSQNKVTALEEELSTAKKLVITSSADLPPFILLSAKYGKGSRYNDVTNEVEKLLAAQMQFNVSNQVLGGEDPYKYTVKELVIDYFSKGESRRLIASEEELIQLDGQELGASQTSTSTRKKKSVADLREWSEQLEGNWILKYTLATGEGAVETVLIDVDGRYFANGRYTFDLRMMNFDQKTMKISYSKIDMKQNLFSKESLTRINQDEWSGSDSKGYRLVYKRVPTNT